MPLEYDTTLSGLELMRQIDVLSTEHDGNAMIPIVDAATDVGRTRFKAKPDQRHLNPFGAVFGGFTSGLIDSATGMAAHSTLPPDSWLATIDLNVKFLRPIEAGSELSVEGWTTHVSKQLIVAEAVIHDAGERKLATGSAIFMVKALEPSTPK